jgi:bifunctional DNA primase/polymerase-like protein
VSARFRTAAVRKAAAGPFAVAALDYFDAGWSPIPTSPQGSKAPSVKGWTGYEGGWPDRAQVAEWIEEFPRANVGLRLGRRAVGLDVDMYDGKAGRRTLAVLTARYGPLPPTWVSTSRRDGSGIRFYRVADGTAFRDPGDGVEVVRWCHRFAVVAPSRHPRDGRPAYCWYAPGGREVRDEIPSPADLPVLPALWAVGLAAGRIGPRGKAPIVGNASDWLKARPGATGRPCRGMDRTLQYWLRKVSDGGRNGGAYGAMVAGVHALVGDAAHGCRGGYEAVRTLGDAYERAVADRRSRRQAASEYERALGDEVAKRAGRPLDTDDLCGIAAAAWGRGAT